MEYCQKSNLGKVGENKEEAEHKDRDEYEWNQAAPEERVVGGVGDKIVDSFEGIEE